MDSDTFQLRHHSLLPAEFHPLQFRDFSAAPWAILGSALDSASELRAVSHQEAVESPCRFALHSHFLRRIIGMKGSPKVIEELNKALREELTAINQYFLHAEMCENWGYRKLSDFIKKQSIGEMRHAESLLERILFLDGVPTMEPLKLTVGSTVKDMIEADLKLEISAVAQYNAAVQIATEQKD